jgi:hypothetical protein
MKEMDKTVIKTGLILVFLELIILFLIGCKKTETKPTESEPQSTAVIRPSRMLSIGGRWATCEVRNHKAFIYPPCTVLQGDTISINASDVISTPKSYNLSIYVNVDGVRIISETNISSFNQNLIIP